MIVTWLIRLIKLQRLVQDGTFYVLLITTWILKSKVPEVSFIYASLILSSSEFIHFHSIAYTCSYKILIPRKYSSRNIVWKYPSRWYLICFWLWYSWIVSCTSKPSIFYIFIENCSYWVDDIFCAFEFCLQFTTSKKACF